MMMICINVIWRGIRISLRIIFCKEMGVICGYVVGFDCFAGYNLMSDYPLSTVSSKKVKAGSRSLFQRSACQTSVPSLLNRAQYQHILSGERVFIELYYQGRVMQTAYNQWIDYMGGVLYKRLNPRVTIFLTNTDTSELSNILDRVKRTCPACRVVSILWFQHCFQAKTKVPFEQYLLDRSSKSKEVTPSKENGQEAAREVLQLQGFLGNIAEDVEGQYIQFFKRRELVGFEVVKSGVEEEVIKGRDIDLGQHPNRKKNNAGANTSNNKKKKVHRTTTKDIPARLEDEPVRSVKSCRKEEGSRQKKSGEVNGGEKQLRNDERQNIQASVQVLGDNAQVLPVQNGKFNSMMDKYLKCTQNSKSSGRMPILVSQARGAQIIQITNNSCTIQHRNQPKNTGIKYSRQSVATYQPEKRKPQMLSRNSNYTEVASRYKDLKKPQVLSSQEFCELQLLRAELVRDVPNRLVVVTESTTLIKKIQFSNKAALQAVGTIHIKCIDTYLYRSFMNNNPPLHTAYFLLNPRRLTDRPLYFSLKSCYPSHPRLVHARIVDEVTQFNQRVRELGGRSPARAGQLRGLRELGFSVRREALEGRRVTFLQTNIKLDVLRLVVIQLGGHWVNMQQYVMTPQVDIVVTSRGTLRNGKSDFMCEEDLWRTVFPMDIQE